MAIVAGAAASSIALVGFGLDSTVEVLSASVIDPLALMDDPAFTDLGTEVSTRLRHAIDAVNDTSQRRPASLGSQD